MVWNKFSLSALFACLEKLERGFQNTALLQFPLNKHNFFPGKLFHSGTTGLCTKTNMDGTAPVEPHQNILLPNRIIQAGLETYFLARSTKTRCLKVISFHFKRYRTYTTSASKDTVALVSLKEETALLCL